VSLVVCDVGPRDGLQNESRTLEPGARAELCDRLAAAGVKRVEAASFVNPRLVPQMAGAEEVMAALHRKPGVIYAGLVLNDKGYERALQAGVDEVHYAFSATDEFGRRNQNATTEEGLKTALALVARARSDRMPVTVTISVPVFADLTDFIVTTHSTIYAPGFSAPSETLIQFGGRVIDNHSNAVMGALVDILDMGLRETTDQSGQFDFEMVPAGTYNVRAIATGFKTQVQSIAVPGLPDDYVIQLAPL